MVIDKGPKKYDEREHSSEWMQKSVKKDLTEPTLLEMSGLRVNQELVFTFFPVEH